MENTTKILLLVGTVKNVIIKFFITSRMSGLGKKLHYEKETRFRVGLG